MVYYVRFGWERGRRASPWDIIKSHKMYGKIKGHFTKQTITHYTVQHSGTYMKAIQSHSLVVGTVLFQGEGKRIERSKSARLDSLRV